MATQQTTEERSMQEGKLKPRSFKRKAVDDDEIGQTSLDNEVLYCVEGTPRFKPLKTRSQPVVDHWTRAVITKNRKAASNALKYSLPNERQLDDLVKICGRRSKRILEICDKICCSVRVRDTRIVSVWAAYCADKAAQEKIAFVVVVKEDIPLDNMKDYKFIIRKQGQVNDEGKMALNSKEFDRYLPDMPVNEINEIRESINKNNVKLMQKHKYLTIISGSPVRSKGYGGNHKIKRESCIVLYVFVKGYIPINEEPFQAKYDGVNVDVREGMFMFYGAKDFQKMLKNGCQIERYLSGTLGGFISHREFGTCGLTSGHVLLTTEEFNNFGPYKTVQDWNFRTDNAIYQPSRQSGQSCGMLVRAIHDQGGRGKSGMDIAIFQVEERYPENGDFPCLKDGRPSEMEFNSGKTVSETRLTSGKVTKFGAATEKTVGKVLLNLPIMSVKYLPENDFNIANQYVLRLHNLFEVETASLSINRQVQPFASFGDSGSLVFCEVEACRLACVGMIEGGTTAGTCAVMPIAPILQRLQITEMKNFENNKLEEKVDKGFRDMNTQFQNLKQQFKNLEQNINAKFAEVISSIQTNSRR